MEIIELNKGVIAMGDEWDYKLWKAQMAWDLAMRIIPPKPDSQGAWTQGNYLAEAQETLERAQEVINAVFTADKPAR